MSKKFIVAIIFFIIGVAMPSFAFGNQKIKYPNVSGQFYDKNPVQLSSDIDTFFSAAKINPFKKHVDIVIVPHAGYFYSGGVAAYGFKAVSENKYKTVIILAPSHFLAFDGISIGQYEGFKTPIGTVEVDQQFINAIYKAKQPLREKIYFEPKAFQREHSLEVEIPFLQKVFKNFKIVPVIMGQADFSTMENFATILHKIIGRREDVLIVVSTDLSHYHSDTFARNMDARSIEAIKKLDAKKVWAGCQSGAMEICGCVPVTTALLYASQANINEADVLHYATSADVTGDKAKVVGYASVVIYGSEGVEQNEKKSKLGTTDEKLTLEQKRGLIKIARDTVEEYVRTGRVNDVTITDPRLTREEGAFVTLHKQGRLRGCIGNIIGRGPLYLTVRDMAISAASRDPRFVPVKKEELGMIDIEISVLTKPRVVKDINEIKLGVHGVIVSRGLFNSGVFLPQVADETGWTKEEFLSQLCSQKANLPADAWKDPSTKLEIFTAEVFSEKDVE